jgi:hypothetical protein
MTTNSKKATSILVPARKWGNRMAAGPWFRRGAAVVSGLLIALALIFVPVSSSPAQAANGVDFLPGKIITDQNMHDTTTMTSGQIQSFLQSQEPSCQFGYSCLKDYRVDTVSRATDGQCAAFTGEASEAASSIIWRVGLACGINPQVLLVLLEKEQSLVSSTAPGTARYTSATGYNCPDSTGCSTDPRYGGLYNQLYWAAWQFKYYETHPSSFSRYAPGRVSNVLYSPNTSCGTASVFIENQATSDLYYYTPYTPDHSALDNLYGTGDGCAAYGNRNFWRIYSDWFGSPSGPRSTFGSLDGAWAVLGGVEVTGWAYDPYGNGASSYAWATIDGVGHPVSANTPLGWFPGLYPGAGANHGFDSVMPASAGTHQVCVYNASNSLPLGCKSIAISASANAAGAIESSSSSVGQVTVSGWSLDLRTSASNMVRVEVDGIPTNVPANLPSTTASSADPTAGSAHGFTLTRTALPGQHLVCVYGTDGASLGCKIISVPQSSQGSVDSVTAANGTISISGWSLDLATPTAPGYIWYTVDGAGGPATANAPLAWIDTYFATIAPYNIAHVGPNHGFNITTPTTVGAHQVCVWASGASTVSLGCQTATL